MTFDWILHPTDWTVLISRLVHNVLTSIWLSCTQVHTDEQLCLDQVLRFDPSNKQNYWAMPLLYMHKALPIHLCLQLEFQGYQSTILGK